MGNHEKQSGEGSKNSTSRNFLAKYDWARTLSA